MSYRNYVLAAYCVFALVLLWDYVAPRWQLRHQWRAARMRALRAQAGSVGARLPGNDDLETNA